VNLFLNALHSMPDGGTLTIRGWTPEITHRRDAVAPAAAANGRVLFEVADTGTGLAPAAVDQVFEPFFTTKPAGKGTGLGLAVVKRIVELHGGTVTLQNRAEGGALATVSMPREGPI
jgi:signal transduction histidine kinase